MKENTCQNQVCVPGLLRHGWLSSSYVWTAIIITVVIIWALFATIDFNSEWYQGLTKPQGIIPVWGFYTIQTIILILVLIGIIMAVHSQKCKPMLCATVLYVFLLLAYFAWLSGFVSFEMIGFSIVSLAVVIFITMWLMWLVSPPRNSSGGWYPMISFTFLLIWLFLMLYYNISFQILNP